MSDEQDDKLTPAERGNERQRDPFWRWRRGARRCVHRRQAVVNTGGGAHYEGPIHTEGDFVGGNKTVTQTAGGDIVGRDKITNTQGMDAAQVLLMQQFNHIQRQVEARPDDPRPIRA